VHAPLRLRQTFCFSAQERNESAPLPTARINLFESRDRFGVVGVQLEKFFEWLDCLGVVSEAVNPKGGNLAEQRSPQFEFYPL
jgi:hypothetical protein